MKRLYGLLGEKLSHSLSPQIHDFIFQHLDIDGAYFLFPVEAEELGGALQGLKLLGAAGVNVTIPYKTAVMPFLDEIAPEAKTIGAVNTIVFQNKHTKGYNTDYQGFGLLLERCGIGVAGKKAVILGTGGSAKMAACYLRDQGAAEIHQVTRGGGSCTDFPFLSYDELSCSKGADILINCTPVGMFPQIDVSPVERELLSRFGTVVDLIYNPFETKLLREAREQGLKTCNGLPMLVGQAVFAQEFWQERKIGLSILEPLQRLLMEHFV